MYRSDGYMLDPLTLETRTGSTRLSDAIMMGEYGSGSPLSIIGQSDPRKHRGQGRRSVGAPLEHPHPARQGSPA